METYYVTGYSRNSAAWTIASVHGRANLALKEAKRWAGSLEGVDGWKTNARVVAFELQSDRKPRLGERLDSFLNVKGLV